MCSVLYDLVQSFSLQEVLLIVTCINIYSMGTRNLISYWQCFSVRIQYRLNFSRPCGVIFTLFEITHYCPLVTHLSILYFAI